VSHDGELDDLAVCFDGEVGDVTDAEVQLIESCLGDLIQRILLTRREEE
jgi:hypothetical protein